jgi:DNA-directed RNA polymerase subunit RPC12/RpoP
MGVTPLMNPLGPNDEPWRDTEGEEQHMVATTCAGCGAKGEVPGPEGMVHKTIICPNCTSRE